MPRASASPACSNPTATAPSCRGPRFSRAAEYPVLGRFNLGTPDPNEPDAKVRVRGIGLQISTPDGQDMAQRHDRSPVLSGGDAASLLRTAEDVRQQGSGCREELRRRASGVRDVRRAGPRARPGPASYAEERYNSLNSFMFVDSAGAEHAVRWSLLPTAHGRTDQRRRSRQTRPQSSRTGYRGSRRQGAAALDHGRNARQSGRSDIRSEQALAGGTAHRRGRHAGGAADRSRTRRPVPRHQFRSDHPADGIELSDDPFPAARSSAYAKSYDLRTSEAKIIPIANKPQQVKSHDQPRQAIHRCFSACLHWLMAACILAMLFIGVGMVSTVMPKYVPLLATHKTLGIAILVLALIRLGVRAALRRAAAARGSAGADEARGGPFALRALYPDDRHAPDRLGDAVGRRLSGRAVRKPASSAILPQSDALHTLFWNAHFYLAFAFFALVLLHLAAALFHALVRRDGVFESMAGVPLHGESSPVRQHGSPQMN